MTSRRARLPSSATVYTIVVVEEFGVQALRHVLWIGGPPGTGKTAVATRIARRHGLRWYGTDTRTWRNRDRALLAGSPAARRWEAMTPQERWVQSTPTEMLDMSLHAERGPMVLDDLRALPASPLVVAEGSTLPAQAISSGIADGSRAVWLLPTDDFQLAEGPRAETPAERRALLREANEAIVAQVRGYFARPWAEGDAESIVREFLCECGSTSCHAGVHVPVAVVMAGAVLASGHH